jgi:hypothetical protein
VSSLRGGANRTLRHLSCPNSFGRPLDIFDLAMHAAPLLLVALKLWRQWRAPPDPGA